MPFWPWYMAGCVALILWGYRAGAAVVAPVAILCGLIVMRFVAMLPNNWRELTAFILWLCVARILMYNKIWAPGALCLLSGAMYPAMLPLGFNIEYLGLVSILADAFLLAALGFWGLAIYSHTHSNRDRVDRDGALVAVGMAKGCTAIRADESMYLAPVGGYSEMKAGR